MTTKSLLHSSLLDNQYYTSMLVGNTAYSPLPPAPSFLSSAPLWLDASDASTITESGGAVSQWDNKGAGSNLTQATGSYQPTTGVSTINGLNVIDFDGSALVAAGTSSEYNFMHNGGKFFIAAVIDWLPKADWDNFLIATRINASAVVGYAIRNDNRTSLGRTNRLITDISRGVAGTLAAEIVEDNYFNSGALIFSSMVDADASVGSRIFYYQNSTQGSSTNTRGDAPSSADSAYKLTVGSSGDLIDGMTGSIAEIAVVNGADATEVNRQAVVDYLNAKWSVF